MAQPQEKKQKSPQKGGWKREKIYTLASRRERRGGGEFEEKEIALSHTRAHTHTYTHAYTHTHYGGTKERKHGLGRGEGEKRPEKENTHAYKNPAEKGTFRVGHIGT